MRRRHPTRVPKPKREGQHLYVLQSRVTGAVKVGRSGDVDARLAEVQTGCPHPLRVILRAEGMGHREESVHEAMRRYHTSGEWFSEDGLGHVPDDVWSHREPWYVEDPDWWKRT